MKLLDIYSAVLKYCGFDTDDQGYINMIVDDKREPAFIDGLRMVMPTDEHLRSFNPKEKIVFHPLTENILRGESEVIQKLKSMVNVRLNVAVGIVAQSLLNLVASPALHNKLSPEQAEVLLAIKDADEKSVTNFITLMIAGIKSNPERLFTNIYLKRGGTHRDKRYSRVGIVTFPFYANLMEDKVDKIRVKDKETYRQLFNFIFPNLEDPEEYNFGSDSHVAPYLEALLRSSANLASRLNDIILLYKDYIDDAERLTFDAEWMEYFQDMDKLIPEIRKVPVQHGSEGTVAPAPEAAPAPQMQMAPQGMVPGQVAAGPGAGYPQTAVASVANRPEVKLTKRGLDFKSVVQNNPVMAMAPNPLAPQMMTQWQQHQMQQAQRLPTWAQPQTPPQMPGMMPGQMPQVPLPQGAQMGPQGPFIMTQQGPVPIQLVQTPQGPMWQMVQMQPMQPMGTIPPWQGPNMLPQQGFGYR